MSNYFDFTKSPRATGTTPSAKSKQPIVTYTPTGAARAPGFINEWNPYDTGYKGAKETEVARRHGFPGGKYDWWDYDNARPAAGWNVQLNDEGYYFNAGGRGPAGVGPPGGGFTGDPILAQAQALAGRQREIARSAALAKRKQAAIEYGDPSGIQGLDDATIQAARNNPFSVLSNLKRGYEEGVESLENDLNASNLFYSGYRGKELGRAATDYQGQRASASSAFQSLLSDVENALVQALLQADWQEAAALEGAYMRALQNALDYGYGHPGGGRSQDDGDGRGSIYERYLRGLTGGRKPGGAPKKKAARNPYGARPKGFRAL